MRTRQNQTPGPHAYFVGMKPLSERDENRGFRANPEPYIFPVGMKPLSERDENGPMSQSQLLFEKCCRNEATL